MSRSIRLVVSDLDGTFWWGREQVHPTTLPAVKALAERGVSLLFATGRRFASARRGLAAYGLGGPAVLMSGAIGAHLESGVEWYRRAFDAEAALRALDAFERAELHPVVYVCDGATDVVVGPACSTHPGHLESLGHPPPGDPREIVKSGRVIGFAVCGLDESKADRAREVAARVTGIAAAYDGPDHVMGGWTLMVSPPNVSKVGAVEAWCAERGVDRSEVLAVGDGTNDVDLLSWAGVSVAVRGGAAERAGADHVIDPPQEGGWARVLGLV